MNFFWKDNYDHCSDKHWLKILTWDKICRHKGEGGVGIRRGEDANAAVLAKQNWKVLKQPDNIWVKLVKSHIITQ